MLRYPLVPFLLLVPVVLSCCGNPSQPAPLMPTTPPGTAGAMAMSYYQALQDHKYTAAYAYLDANTTDTSTGQRLTLQIFIQIAQESENVGGPISSFHAASYPPLVVVTVSRSGGPYHVHLHIKQEGSAWTITSLDRI